ncbi:hypothetical protein QE152_g25790 [Popillia japonica]|uniref:Uncharacterized protein n=1 Tax=Popillia japonica TaxID=7064 RepID=A0AAW1JYT7_POPJA
MLTDVEHAVRNTTSFGFMDMETCIWCYQPLPKPPKKHLTQGKNYQNLVPSCTPTEDILSDPKRKNRDGDGDRTVPHGNRPEAQPLAEDDETDDVNLRDMNAIEGEKENERTNTIETPNAENAADPDQDQPIHAKNGRED